jgi:hypothetical protein
MSDGLVPVRDRMLRGVPGCEQCHVPGFPTLLCVTRSGFRELQERTVGGEKYKWAEEQKYGRPVRYPGTGLVLRRAKPVWTEYGKFTQR